MVKLTAPLMSQNASGSIMKRITYSERKSGSQVRYQRAQKDRQSAVQLTQRAIYIAAVAAWNALTDEQKATYEAQVIDMSMTGFNLFIQQYILNPPAPPAEDIERDGTVITGNNENTKSITIAENDNRILIVQFTSYQGGEPSGITHNGQALTKVAVALGSYGENSSIWALLNPVTGTHDIIITGANSWYGWGAQCLFNVKQELPTNDIDASGEGNFVALDITTEAAKSWIVAAIEAEPVITMATVDGVEDFNLEGQSYQHGQGQHFVKEVAGAKEISADLSYAARWNICIVEIKKVT